MRLDVTMRNRHKPDAARLFGFRSKTKESLPTLATRYPLLALGNGTVRTVAHSSFVVDTDVSS
jgi:hypothetical protein